MATKVFEVVTEVIKGTKPEEEVTKTATDAYFDILLRDLRYADSTDAKNFEWTEKYGLMMHSLVLGELHGNDVSKATMLSKFMVTIGTLLDGKRVNDAFAKVQESAKPEFATRFVRRILADSMRLTKKWNSKTKQLEFIQGRDATADYMLGEYAALLTSMKPVFDFLRNSDWEKYSSPDTAKAVADAAITLMNKTGNPEKTVAVLDSILRNGKKNGFEKSDVTAVEFYTDYFMKR